jgi:hypothetical protein
MDRERMTLGLECNPGFRIASRRFAVISEDDSHPDKDALTGRLPHSYDPGRYSFHDAENCVLP